MPTPDADYNLPGVSVSIADFGLRISPPVPGKKLTLVGATTGTLGGEAQLNEPYAVRSVGLAVNGLKNTDGTHSELSLAVEQAAAAGARNIEVVISAFTSEYANANARWDSLAATYRQLKSHPVDVIHPVDTWVDDVTGLSGTDTYGDARNNFGKQLANFCYRAGKEGNSAQGVIGLKPLLRTAYDEDWSVKPTSEAEINYATPTLAQVNEWIDHVQGLNGTLENHTAETALDSYLEGSIEESPGVISSDYDWWAKEEDGTTAVDHLGNNVDGGRAICVFGSASRQASDSIPNLAAQAGYPGTRSINTNGAVAYSALLSTLSPIESPTGKTIPSLTPARQVPESFGRDMMNSRVVTMVNRTTGYVVTKGISSAHNASAYTRSDFVQWTTFSIVLAAIDLAKIAVEPFIGKQSSPAVMNAMKVALDESLKVLKDLQAVSRIQANIIQTSDQAILGDMDIDLDIDVFGEISNINFRAALSRS